MRSRNTSEADQNGPANDTNTSRSNNTAGGLSVEPP